MVRKTAAPVQWARSLLMVGAIVVLTGSNGCGPTSRPIRKQTTPFNPSPTTGTNGTNTAGQNNAPQPYRNLPGAQGQDTSGQAGQTPIDPSGKAGWGQSGSASPSISTPAGMGTGSPTTAGLAAPSGNTTHYVPGVSPVAPQDPGKLGQSIPDPLSPNRQTAQYGGPQAPPQPPDPPALRSSDAVRPLSPGQGLAPLDDTRSQTGLSRPMPIPPPPSDTGLAPIGGSSSGLPRFGSAGAEQPLSDPALAAPPPSVNKLPSLLPPG